MDEEKNIPVTEEECPCSECGACPCPQEQVLPEKCTVVDVHFREGGKDYYFDPGRLELKPGDHVILNTARGSEYGIVAVGNHVVSAKELVPPLRNVIRRASPRDESIRAENLRREKKAFALCQQKIAERQLEMQLVSAEYAFDGSKVMFFFTSENRVDFRELVKDLAAGLHTRIELRQIGVRDKAKMVGGLGICGRPFCCKEFLPDFAPVSIKMAKTQNLSLNPTKISGTCGRLMCCLKYEQDAYEDLLKTAPKAESFVDTPDGRGTVTEVNLMRQSVRVRMENEPERTAVFKNQDIYVIRSGKAKKTDEPIPEDFAPISSRQQPRRRLEADTPLPEVKLAGENIAVPVEAPAKKERGYSQHRRKYPEREQKLPVENNKPVPGEKKPGEPEKHAEQKNGHPRRHRPFYRKNNEGGKKTEG